MKFLPWKCVLMVRTLSIAIGENIQATLVLRANWNTASCRAQLKTPEPSFSLLQILPTPRLVSFSDILHNMCQAGRAQVQTVSSLQVYWERTGDFPKAWARACLSVGGPFLNKPCGQGNSCWFGWHKLNSLICLHMDKSNPDHCLLPQALL